MECTVCHAQAYNHCGTCHLGTDEAGHPYSQATEGRIEVKIGRDQTHVGKKNSPAFTLVRQIPIQPDTYKAYLGEDLGRFSALPTFKHTSSPHNIQRKTWQSAHCNHCHGNRKLFLTTDDLTPELLAANREVVVPDKMIPRAIPGLTPMQSIKPAAGTPVRVGAGWLNEHLHDKDLIILDVREKVDYEDGHIPGAFHLCFCNVRHSSSDRPPFLMFTPEELMVVFQDHLPLTPDKRVVIYDDGSAKRGMVFLALELIGHQKVSFLDGSFATWEAADLPTEDGPAPDFAPVAPYPMQARPLIMETTELRNQIETDKLILLDARKVIQHLGHSEHKPASRPGHIPGSINLPLRTLVNTKGEVLPPIELAWHLRNIHIYPGVRATIVTSCNTNQLASEMYMILRSLGYENVMVHSGSWVEWAEMTK
jgi:thiosulfate/3-mercaptopyruvate sulfurtransferase